MGKMKLAEMKDRLSYMHVKGEKKREIEDMMENIWRTVKTIKTGNRDDLPKRLIMTLIEEKRDLEYSALAKASSPPKTAESVQPPTTTEASASTSTTKATIAMAGV